jgi:tRNA A-37 threonylcarbamoyl transferase component Bud32
VYKNEDNLNKINNTLEVDIENKTKKIITPYMNKGKKYNKLEIKTNNDSKKENEVLNDNNENNLIKTPKNLNLKFKNRLANFYTSKKDISSIQSDKHIRNMKLISLQDFKYMKKNKAKFNKSSNDNEENILRSNQLLRSGKNMNRIDNKKINLNLNLNISINNYLSRSYSIKEAHNFRNKLNSKISAKNYVNNIRNNLEINQDIEPNENFIPEDFIMIKQIGEGSFGKIYCSEWKKNGKKYAMKKMILRNKIEIKKNQEQTDLVYDLIKSTKTKGVINIYGAQCIKVTSAEYHFYVLMELANIDWEKEIKKRKENKEYYTEGELFDILKQLTETFSLLQKNHITHRDIKPQNILVVNGQYKLCDFGEIRVMQREGIVVQRVRGSELYMSPILFYGLRSKKVQVRHNTYKSDVFSLGMCLFFAAGLSYRGPVEIREVSDMKKKEEILNRRLSSRYSKKLINILHLMLQTKEVDRPDFILLEEAIKKYGL